MYKHPIAFLSVNNLTGARYAAAMMVDYVGFCLDYQHEPHVTVEKAKEILGWLSGVKRIGEFYSRPADEIAAIVNELNIDMVLLYGAYSAEDLALIQVPVVATQASTPTVMLKTDDGIYKSNGELFCLFFTVPDENETGVIDFEEINNKLESLES